MAKIRILKHANHNTCERYKIVRVCKVQKYRGNVHSHMFNYSNGASRDLIVCNVHKLKCHLAENSRATSAQDPYKATSLHTCCPSLKASLVTNTSIEDQTSKCLESQCQLRSCGDQCISSDCHIKSTVTVLDCHSAWLIYNIFPMCPAIDTRSPT